MKRLFLTLLLAASFAAARAYTIYPVPHEQSVGEALTLPAAIRIEADATIDAATLARATDVLTTAGYTVADDATYTLRLATSTDATEPYMQDGKYDRHSLTLTAEAITIRGEHTNAVFCGLASLEQILEQPLTAATLVDWADQQNRGIVEGYYGYPYSVSVKKDLMHFMMRYKMNTYLYGAKSDPYHSQYWKDAYPTTLTAEQEKNGWLSQDMVRELSQTSAETKVNFIWAIHPGNNFVGSATAVSDIMQKYTKMHALGVRQFGVFVDDVGIPSSQADMQTNAQRLTDLQHAIEAKWNTPDAAPADTVRPIHFVPQIYCSSFASSAEQRQNFMAALGTTPSYITIYTTGQAVWTVPNSGHMDNMHNELGRDMAWWWNYPCNDNADGQIYIMDMYSNFFDLPMVDGNARLPQALTHTIGVVANPMQEGEVAKSALFSIADYTWNNGGFDHQASWEASFRAMIADSTARQAYRALAPYLRWNDPEALNTLISRYKNTHDAADLTALITEIKTHCETVAAMEQSEVESDRLLYADVRPWLLKLKADCETALALLRVSTTEADLPQRWDAYVAALQQYDDRLTNTAYTAYALEGMGNGISVSQRQAQPAQRYFEPFITWLKDNAMAGIFTDQQPTAKATLCTNLENFRPSVTSSASTGKYYMQAGTRRYQPGEYIGLKLPCATRLADIEIADTLYQRHAVIWSENGRTWHRITSADVPDGHVRYFLVVNDTDQPVSWKLSNRSFTLYRPLPTTIASSTLPDGDLYQNHGANLYIDGNLTTFACLNRNQRQGDMYTVDLGKATTIHDVRIYMGTTNGDYMTEGRVQVSEDGSAWKALRVVGETNNFRYSLDMPQNVRLNNDVTYCDFDGRGLTARYVRLNVTTPNTAKWLRLYEITVNNLYIDRALRSILTSGDDLNQPRAIDGNGSTAITATAPSPLTLRLEEQQPTESVTLFTQPNGTDAQVSALLADSTTVPLGALTASCQTFSLDGLDAPIALQLTYTTAPALYEVMLTPAEGDPYSVLTAIHTPQAATAPAPDKVYDLQGRRVSHPRRGLYIKGNRKVAVK